jgi:hypothetical protein
MTCMALGVAEEDNGRQLLADARREAVAIAIVAAPHKGEWHCNPV